MSTAQHLTESSTGLKGHTALGSYEIAAVPSGLAHSIYTNAVSTTHYWTESGTKYKNKIIPDS